jgi:uncharacterized protein YbjT (DUF2867 family)
MKVLLTGATGFIGQAVAESLLAAGHHLVCVLRDPARLRLAGAAQGRVEHIRLDFANALSPTDWLAAAAATGVRRIVQVSALGADAAAQSAFHLSKRAADEHLRKLGVPAVIAQPSLVYGT